MSARRRIVATIGILIGLLLLAVLLDVGTASPRVCSSCHEMRARTRVWARSAHQTVACVKCHLPARPWYAVAPRLIDRASLLARDIAKHNAGGYDDPVERRSGDVAPIGEDICLQCHDPNRKATSGFRIKIDHAEHARRNGTCLSCHVRTAHPTATRGRAMTLMSQCFTCHGVGASAKAPGECKLCHPSGYSLKPASHRPKKWQRSHGEISVADPRQCTMCHSKSYCRSCHGLEMPHPKQWAQGKTGHGRVAGVNRGLCDRCHAGGPDLCSMCHHTTYQPSRGTWVKQHYAQVREEGLGRCLDCHSPVFCSGCHASGPQGGA